MKHKILGTAAVTSALLAGMAATSAHAFDISGNIALVSDYRFRGISQSNEDAAVQGGLDATFESGFYIGTWASSVDFGDVDDGSGSYGTMEIDYYAGWGGPIADSDFSVDVGYMYYQYPGDTVDPSGDYQEIHATGSWNDLSVGVIYSNDFYAETGKYFYYTGDYSMTVAEDFSLALHVGYNDFDKSGFFATDEDTYTDYSVTVGYTFKGVDLSVAWVGTDLDDVDCFDSSICDDTAVFSISKSL
jgi:uncharacterized protein (TIGR02001 family)